MLDALDVPLETGLAALADFQPLAGRGQVTRVAAPGGAFTLIDESYNANPLSMAAGFRSLGARPVLPGGRRSVVLTDMLELGDRSRDLHEGLAQPIEAAGLDLVHTAGPEMKRLHDALPAEAARQAATRLSVALAPHALVLPGTPLEQRATLEDLWMDARVQRRWLAFVEQLSPLTVERLLRQLPPPPGWAVERHAGAAAVEGWAA